MSRFSLKGLLRVRTVQEEQARRDLGAAQGQLERALRSMRDQQHAVSQVGPPPSGPAEVFLAGAAARAGMAAAVNDAVTYSAACELDLERARSQWLEARMRARAVERLAERAREAEQADQLRAEQLVSDDLAGARQRRDDTEDRP